MVDAKPFSIHLFVRSYFQVGERRQIIFEHVDRPQFDSSIEWELGFRLSTTTVINLCIHVYHDFDISTKKYICDEAVKLARQLLEESANYSQIMAGKFAIPTEDENILQFTNDLNNAIENMKKNRMVTVVHYEVSVNSPPYPEFIEFLPAYTQIKLTMSVGLFVIAGSPPNQRPISQTITYTSLPMSIVTWLEKAGVPASRDYAPFASDWIRLFEGGRRLPTQKNRQKFFDHLIHVFLVEAQLLVNQRYYEELGFENQAIPLELPNEISPDEIKQKNIAYLNSPQLKELYARIFLEYHIIMLRAQWDKIARLACYALDVDTNFDSIDDGFKLLRKVSDLPQSSKATLDIFLGIGQRQLEKDPAKGGWFRPFRDGLLHYTAKHSSGVQPQANSLESTFHLWERTKIEHNYFREALMALVASLLIAAWTKSEK